MTRSICIPMRAAAGALALLASPVMARAQQPPSASTATPTENSAAAPKDDATPAAESGAKETIDTNAASACKGLVELACRKNKVCTWIIPKEADKTGQVPAAYCRKLGPTKKKPKSTEAGEVSPVTPPPEKKPPATSAPAP